MSGEINWSGWCDRNQNGVLWNGVKGGMKLMMIVLLFNKTVFINDNSTVID